MSESISTSVHTCLVSDDQWEVGGIGRAGIHFKRKEGEESFMSSSLTTSNPNVEQELHRLAQGGVFIDSREVDEAALTHLVISGPMLVHKSEGSQNQIKPRAEAGPFDYIELSDYIASYFEIGARVGYRVGNRINWTRMKSTNQVESIAPCTCWHYVCLGCHRLRYYVDRQYKPSGECVSRMPADPNDHCPECKAKP